MAPSVAERAKLSLRCALYTGPIYNKQFNAQNCARSSRVLVVTELFNSVVNETALIEE